MAQSNPRAEALSALRWLADAGADEAVLDEPLDRFRAAPQTPPRDRVSSPLNVSKPAERFAAPQVETRRVVAAPSPPAPPANDKIGRAMELAAAVSSLPELKAALESFEGCALKKSATNTVFADGTPEGRIMLIGEAPGREEDQLGLPFVGRAGKLLDKMLAAIALDRRSNVYITNVLNWRPPSNRDPTPEEAGTCLPFLRRHIELADPALIILLGAVAARHVLGRSDGIMRLRGNWTEYHVNGRLVPLLPTLHPAYLLRRPVDKKLAWRDLQSVAGKIGALGLLEPDRGSG